MRPVRFFLFVLFIIVIIITTVHFHNKINLESLKSSASLSYFSAFSRTGFDQHTSPVFSPANPESSIEDSLAVLGDRVSRDLDTHLFSATHTLLSRSFKKSSENSLAVLVFGKQNLANEALLAEVYTRKMHCVNSLLTVVISYTTR